MGSAGKYANGGKYALTGLDSRLRGNDDPRAGRVALLLEVPIVALQDVLP
jgi:hypothetical protein